MWIRISGTPLLIFLIIAAVVIVGGFVVEVVKLATGRRKPGARTSNRQTPGAPQ